MGCLGNALWFVLGGCVMGLSWAAVGLLWCISVVGIPVGVQCFKFARLCFFPFGKELFFTGGAGLLFCLTVVGIPFGLQCFKIARLALTPFGAAVR